MTKSIFHQVLTKWYNKVCKADSKAILYPWTVADCEEHPTLLVENPTDIPQNVMLLKKFVHKLFLWMSRGDYHVQILMGSNEDLSMIMQMVGWWSKSTTQGMWLTDLQAAEETTMHVQDGFFSPQAIMTKRPLIMKYGTSLSASGNQVPCN